MLTVESQPASNAIRLFVVMGVAGCGKTSIGTALAKELNASFIEGDKFHPPNNILKMERGVPLTDDDRWPWLELVAQEMIKTSGQVFVGCSALKRVYRNFISTKVEEPVKFILLAGNRKLIAERMKLRSGHFMPLSLLDSQFKALEIPEPDECHISVEIAGSEKSIVERILRQI